MESEEEAEEAEEVPRGHSSASWEKQREQQIHNGHLSMFVCLAHTLAAHLSHFWNGVELEVNGKLKKMCLCCT